MISLIKYSESQFTKCSIARLQCPKHLHPFCIGGHVDTPKRLLLRFVLLSVDRYTGDGEFAGEIQSAIPTISSFFEMLRLLTIPTVQHHIICSYATIKFHYSTEKLAGSTKDQ